MYEFLNPQGDYLGEEEVMKILNIAYQGLNIDEEIKYEDIASYLNYHGGQQIEGKISKKEFENMVMRLLSGANDPKMNEIK